MIRASQAWVFLYANRTVITSPIITSRLHFNEPRVASIPCCRYDVRVTEQSEKPSRKRSGIRQHIRICRQQPAVARWASDGASGAATPRGPRDIYIILHAQPNGRHPPTATSLVNAAPEAPDREKALIAQFSSTDSTRSIFFWGNRPWQMSIRCKHTQ